MRAEEACTPRHGLLAGRILVTHREAAQAAQAAQAALLKVTLPKG